MSEIKDSHIRFNKVDWYGANREITIGGVGTIGSWLTFLLARAGDHELLMYDPDVVEIENLAGQLYNKEHVGEGKGKAMSNMLRAFTEHPSKKVFVFKEFFDDTSHAHPVCFSCFDNMKARKDMFERWKSNSNREIFIDGRMTIESYEVYAVTPGREKEYEKTLFDSSEIEEEQICSLKNTSHTGALIAGRMVSIFTNHLTNQKLGIPLRTIPFKVREEMQLQRIEICK